MPDMNMQTYEEVSRHQLVTEFDVQSQSELTDYQVQLENADNPTQAQDNFVVGSDGESLPHWNESVDFDTWLKTNVATSGKRGLLIHGNAGLSSVSSITDVALEGVGDEFNDASIDTTIWDTGNNNGTWDETSGVLTGSDSGALWMRSKVVGTDYHIWALGKSSDMDSAYIMANVGVTTDPWTNVYAFRAVESNQLIIARPGSTVESETVTLTADAYYYHEIKKVDGDLTYKIYDSSKTLLQTVTYSDGTPLSGGRIAFRGFGETLTTDLMVVGKSTANEPTYTIGTPKNISTALKSFGMAG